MSVSGTPPPALPMRGCFVTGTDTEVGKTTVSAGLLHLLAAHGVRVAGCKPVAAGTLRLADGRVCNDDVEQLIAASSVPLTAADVCGALLHAACAPHIAAAAEGRVLTLAPLLRLARALADRADAVVVEGVGGFCVPLALGDDPAARAFGMDDLASALQLPVLLVVGLRLGCLNHALLTAAAVQARGLRLAGWIGCASMQGMDHADANLDTLRRLLAARHGAPCVGVVPRLDAPTPATVAAHLDAKALMSAVFAPSAQLSPSPLQAL